MIPEVNSCCGSASLKTGSKAIGWFTLIYSIIIAIVLAMGVVALFAASESQALKPDEQKVVKAMAVVACVFLVIQVIACVLPVILLLGVYKENGCMLLTWVWITLILSVISLISIIFSFDAKQGMIWIRLFYVLLNFYFVAVVNSYYKETVNRSSNA